MKSLRIALPITLLAACSDLGTKPELPKTPMGMGQISIEAVTNDPEGESSLRVSPDGRYLLFNLNAGEGRSAAEIIERMDRVMKVPGAGTYRNLYRQTSIALMELGKPGKTIVSQQSAIDPSWFPNGRTFGFSMLQAKDQAMLASTTVGEGTAAVRFISPSPCVAFDKSPSISPDGQRVLFGTAGAGEVSTIAVMDMRTSESKCRILFPGMNPQWAPSGKKFVFSRVVNEHTQVFTFNEAQNQLTQITFGDFDSYSPSWSPDGRSIVFVTTRNGTPDIYTIAEDGSALAQVTQGPTNDRSPSWSRDGAIYFVSNAGGQTDIWRAQVSGASSRSSGGSSGTPSSRKSASSGPATAASEEVTKAVTSAIDAWANAWQSGNVDAYFAAYAPDFKPEKGSRSTWEAQRRDRVGNAKKLKITVGNPQVTSSGSDRATAKFTQIYESESHSDTSEKTLELKRVDGKWLIVRERAS